jgi:cysteine desulfurase
VNKPDPKYFDYAASTPPFEEARNMFAEISRNFFGNPSSMHKEGTRAKNMLNELKKEFCDLVNFSDGRLLLCSSATEANNTIIEGYVRKYPTNRILIAEDAHDSIWYAIEKHPDQTDILKINASGQIDIDRFIYTFKPETRLVCINHACNELGTIHDVERIGAICQTRDIKLLIDGTQAIGHIPVDMNTISCDYYTFSAHKFGGVRSAGGILMRDNDFIPLLSGGKQEWNVRAGTENIGGLASAVTALKKSIGSQEKEMTRLSNLAEGLTDRLKELIPSVLVNTSENSLPGFLSLSFPGFKGNEIVAALSLSGFSVSTGSACHAHQIEPSRIILSLGRDAEQATGTIRISMGYGSTEHVVDKFLEALVDYIRS